jgi:hypothetical protein
VTAFGIAASPMLLITIKDAEATNRVRIIFRQFPSRFIPHLRMLFINAVSSLCSTVSRTVVFPMVVPAGTNPIEPVISF